MTLRRLKKSHVKDAILVFLTLVVIVLYGRIILQPWPIQQHDGVSKVSNSLVVNSTGTSNLPGIQRQIAAVQARLNQSAATPNTLDVQTPAAHHIMVLLGTRPEAIKLAPVVLELRRRPDQFFCTLVSTGQHEAILRQVLAAFGLDEDAVDISLRLMMPDQTLAGLTARVVESMDYVLEQIQPDMILVQGDTTTAFAGALAAFYHKIPTGHVEAGLRTRDLYSPFPEEVNRQGIGTLASLHFAATDVAAMNLIAEGKDTRTIFVTGALRRYASGAPSAAASARLPEMLEQNGSAQVARVRRALAERCNEHEGSPKRCQLILLTAHRRENHGAPLRNIMAAVATILHDHSDALVVYPVHLNPNVRAAIRASVPEDIYAQLERGQDDGETFPLPPRTRAASYYDRFLLLPPLD